MPQGLRHRASNEHRQNQCDEDRTEGSKRARIANGRRAGDERGIGQHFDRRDPRAAAQPQLLPRHADALAGAVIDEPRCRIVAPQQFHETWILVLQPRGRTELKTELAIWIRMEEVIARIVYDVDTAALACGPANAIEHGPQVEIGDHNSKPPTVGGKHRRGNPHDRHMRDLDDALVLSKLDWRDVNVPRRQCDRLLEIIPIAHGLKLRVGYRADGAARSRTVHANDFAPVVAGADEAQIVVPGLCGQFRREPRCEPTLFSRRKYAGAIGDVARTCTHHLVDGKAQHVGPGTTDYRFEFGCKKLYVTAEALQRSRHGDAQEIAVGQRAGHGDRDQNQRHHGDGQTRGKLHDMVPRGSGPGIASQEKEFGRPPRVIARPFAETRQISSNVRLQPFCGGAALRAWAARGQAAAQPRAIMASRDKASPLLPQFPGKTRVRLRWVTPRVTH